jgi:two-component system phosphate regulon sensor histidine kinase PhoR
VLASRFHWKVYAGIVSLVLGTTALLGFLVSRRIERDALEDLERSLRAKAALLADLAVPSLAGDQDPALQERLRRLGDEIGTRLTVVGTDGAVLADSHEEPSRMDDHGNRPEIAAAREAGFGLSMRHSRTVGTRMMYLARAVRDGGRLVGFVRTALPLTEVGARLSRVRSTVAVVAILASVIGIGVGFPFARRVTRPLVAMTRAAEAIAAGDYGAEVRSAARDEFGKLARSLDAMSRQLRERMETIERDRNEILGVLEGMVEGVVAVDRDERVLLLNGVAGRILRAEPRAVLGKPIWEASRILEVRDALRGAMDAGAERTAEIALPAPGRDRALVLRASPLRGGGGAVVGAVLVLHDVTELRRLEGVRRDFVANVSHELKTPLTAIHGLVETLLDDPSIDEGKRREYLERIRVQSERMSSLVADLLTLSRVESGEAVLDRSPLDLRERVRDSARRFLPAAEAKALRLETVLPQEPVVVLGDAQALSEVVDNLLDNAVKYTPAGGRVWVRVDGGAGSAVLEVEDTGPGIAPRDRDRIFERFYRVDKARSRELGGTGLGLAIVKHIVLALGGEVSVESAPGAGSTFRVRLPRG